MPTDFIGQTFGSYKLVELIGRGGMASVYRGYQESIDRSVAVKVLPPEFLHDPNFSQRFVAEARTLAKMTHPAILPLYDFGTANDVPYIVMPLMTGGTLADRMRRNRLSLPEVQTLFALLADALDYAHSLGVVHRDIKPSNILFDARSHPFLADFGIAKAIEASSNLTGTGIVGTPDYMSPEQARGEQIDGRSDIYSLGVMAYQALAGESLFKATTPIGVMLKHVTEPPPPIRQVRPELPPGLEAVLTKVLAKQPAERYQTGKEFMQALSLAARSTATNPEPVRPVATTSLHPSTARQQGPITAPQPSYVTGPQTIPPPKSGGGLGGVLLGGGVGVVVGVILIIVLIVACCVGAVIMLPTATPTPLPTATLPPTATPIPFLLADQFSDSTSGWETGAGDISSIDYVSGEYVIRVIETGWFVWGNPAKNTYSNISVQVNARYTNGNYTDILFGAMCNFQDNQHYYYMGITTDGYYGIGKRNGDEDILLSGDGSLTFSNQLAQGNSWFRLNADCAGDGTLSLYADGILLESVTDTSYPSGNIGLFNNVYAPASGDINQPAEVEIHFDDLSITSLP